MVEGEPQRSGKQTSPIWVVGGLAVFGVGVLVMLNASAAPNGEEDARRETAPLVEVATPEPASRTYVVRAPGRLRPRQTLDLASEVSGKIAFVSDKLEIGGRFDEGEVVVRLDAGDFVAERERAEAALATAKARLATAEADFKRQSELAEIGAAPSAVLEQARATFEDARAAVRQAESQLTLEQRAIRKTVIRAPFPALVVSETAALGQFLQPGAAFARLIDATAGEIEAGLSPTDVPAVRRAAAASDGPLRVRAAPNAASIGGATLEGRLSDFSPSVDPGSRTVSVVAVFPDAFAPANDGEVFAEDFMTLEIDTLASTPVWRVPEGAVREDSFVWVIDASGRTSRRNVNVLDYEGGSALISTDRASLDDARIVVTSLEEEVDGQRVRVAALPR